MYIDVHKSVGIVSVQCIYSLQESACSVCTLFLERLTHNKIITIVIRMHQKCHGNTTMTCSTQLTQSIPLEDGELWMEPLGGSMIWVSSTGTVIARSLNIRSCSNIMNQQHLTGACKIPQNAPSSYNPTLSGSMWWIQHLSGSMWRILPLTGCMRWLKHLSGSMWRILHLTGRIRWILPLTGTCDKYSICLVTCETNIFPELFESSI